MNPCGNLGINYSQRNRVLTFPIAHCNPVCSPYVSLRHPPGTPLQHAGARHRQHSVPVVSQMAGTLVRASDLCHRAPGLHGLLGRQNTPDQPPNPLLGLCCPQLQHALTHRQAPLTCSFLSNFVGGRRSGLALPSGCNSGRKEREASAMVNAYLE